MIKFKKFYFFIIITVLILIIYPRDIYADFGPKPAVNIVFEGIDEPFYATLLSEDIGFGPWRSLPENNGRYPEEIFNSFLEYKDKDDYKFLGYIRNVENKEFEWSYYTPSDFKILIYLHKNDKFIISKPYKSYSFHSYFKAGIKDDEFVFVKNNYNYKREIFFLLIRILITIAVELVIAYIFKIRTLKYIKIIIYTNILTQGLLNIGIWLFNYKFGFGIFIYILIVWIIEIIIFLIEGTIYKKLLKEFKYPYIYSFLANLTTYLLGFTIMLYIL